VVNQASWQETFQALWVSALRLIQRVNIVLAPLILSLSVTNATRILLIHLIIFSCLCLQDSDPWEGPFPRLEARLCMLLSIVPLAIVPVVMEEGEVSYSRNGYEHGIGEKYSCRRQGLVFALQVLGQFSGLLSPPALAVTAANNAASKAATFISNFKAGSGNHSAISNNDSSVKAGWPASFFWFLDFEFRLIV